MKLFTINGWPFFTNKDKEKNYLQLEKVRPTFFFKLHVSSFFHITDSLTDAVPASTVGKLIS